MNNTKLLLASVFPLVASSVCAADLTAYGIVAVGPTYVSNQSGSSVTRMDAGTLQQSRLGRETTDGPAVHSRKLEHGTPAPASRRAAPHF